MTQIIKLLLITSSISTLNAEVDLNRLSDEQMIDDDFTRQTQNNPVQSHQKEIIREGRKQKHYRLQKNFGHQWEQNKILTPNNQKTHQSHLKDSTFILSEEKTGLQDQLKHRSKESRHSQHGQVYLNRNVLKKDIQGEDPEGLNYSKQNGRHQKTKQSLKRVTKLDHFNQTSVTDKEFAYMVAVMKGADYLCAGAVIDESWVLTAADAVFLMRDSIRLIRVRLGSVNYKKGGTVLPLKYLEIHPYFNINNPNYDLALLMLSKPVRYTPSLRSIRLQLTPRELTSTHFIVTSWSGHPIPNTTKIMSVDDIKSHRLLSMIHLHPSDPEDCVEELSEIEAGHEGILCLETGSKDGCTRQTGAPVVINNVLWGVISSWIPEDCDDEDPSSIFANAVSAINISTWIHATVHGHKWRARKI